MDDWPDNQNECVGQSLFVNGNNGNVMMIILSSMHPTFFPIFSFVVKVLW